MIHSADTLVGGRIRYTQTLAGHRSGIEPVLLAAAIPACAGAHVVEAGTGAGAGLLCLGHRVPGIAGIGIERDPDLAMLARDNFAANGMVDVRAVAGDVLRAPVGGGFDHGFANPPWRDPRDTASPDAGRRLAYVACAGVVQGWITALAALVRPRGSVTLIVPATLIGEALGAFTEARCGTCRVLPLWPRAGRSAKLIIVQAIKSGRGPTTLLPGLILHDEAGFTPEAEAVLRHGSALDCAPAIVGRARNLRESTG